MNSIYNAVIQFIVYTALVIIVFSVLDQPVQTVIGSIANTAQSYGISIDKDLLVKVWHAIPVVLLCGMLIWLLLYVHRVEPEEYYFEEEEVEE